MGNSTWRDLTLGDFVRLQRGHDLPAARQRMGSVPVMGSAGQNGLHDTAKAKGPGVTVGRSGVGSMGVVNYCPVDYWPHNTVLYVTDFMGNDERFAYYFLKQLDLKRYNSGSVQASLNRNFIYPISIRVPPIREQRRIVKILRALDDKIELNRRMNETLEAMARRLFKSWFVDFDPTHAKAALRRQHPKWTNDRLSREALPNLDPKIAQLFPDELVESELGLIPEGWRAVPFPEAIDVNPGRTLAKGAVIRWLDMARMPTRSARATSYDLREFKSGTKFINGDTLVARITPCLENGKTAFVDFLENGSVGAGSTEYIVLHPSEPLPPEYGYFLARTEKFRKHLISNMTGTSGRQRAPADCLNAYHVIVPNEGIADCFGDFASDSLTQMKSLDGETDSLTATRDRLLPKLLSGELSCDTEAIP